MNQFFFFLQLFLCGTHGIYFYFFSSTEHCAWAIISPKEFKFWVTRISFALLYIRENRIICCQIFCDLLLKSAFERIFNVMQLILVNIKWHIKWKYLIQKFHDICLSICHINAKSLYAFDKDLKSNRTKLYEIESVLCLQHRYDIICISETWLKSNVSCEDITINNYAVYRKDR